MEDCPLPGREKICGTNGKQYHNMCHLKVEACAAKSYIWESLDPSECGTIVIRVAASNDPIICELLGYTNPLLPIC